MRKGIKYLLLILVVTLVTTILDLIWIKVYDFWGYLALNFWEWFMFGMGYAIGKDVFNVKSLFKKN